MLSEWSLMRRDDGLVVNYYGPYRVKTSLADGTPLELRQETSYPLDGTIRLTLDLKQPKTFTLYLRRPGWVARRSVCRQDQRPKDRRRCVDCSRRLRATDSAVEAGRFGRDRDAPRTALRIGGP